MNKINEIKDETNTKTVNLVLLSLATVGIYPLIWLSKNFKKIDELTKIRTIDNNYIIWMAVCIGLSSALRNDTNEINNILSLILMIASSTLYIVWAFKTKNALEEYALTEYKIDLRMNLFYTFFLNIFYINYSINSIPEEFRKQQILNGQK